MRINRAADVGADMGLLFPRKPQEAEEAPQHAACRSSTCKAAATATAVRSFSRKDLQQMGYVGCIEAQVMLCTAFHFLKRALTELRETGDYTGMTKPQYVAARQEVEDLIGLDEYYEIEAETVERRS